MVNRYINRDKDISRLTNIFKEETKDGVNKEFTICSSQYRRLNPNSITVYEHPDSIRKIAEDGKLKIIDSWPQLDNKAPGFLGQSVYKVLVFADKFKEHANNQQLTTKLTPAKIKRCLPPQKWQLIEKNKKIYLEKDNEAIFIFPTNWSQKYIYFKCLWNFYNLFVPYKQIYEYESNLTYPKKGITKVNRNIRSIFTKLKKEIGSLPISIEINKGARLTFKG